MRPRRRAGLTANGGADGYGTIFSMTAAGALDYAPQLRLNRRCIPIAALVQGMDGNFYGSTSTGGSGGLGAPFSLAWSRRMAVLRNRTSTYANLQ